MTTRWLRPFVENTICRAMGEPEPNTGDYGEIKNCQFRSLDNATCITVKFEKVKRPALYIVKWNSQKEPLTATLSDSQSSITAAFDHNWVKRYKPNPKRSGVPFSERTILNVATCQLVITPSESSAEIAIGLCIISSEPGNKKASIEDSIKVLQHITKNSAMLDLARKLYNWKKKPSGDSSETKEEGGGKGKRKGEEQETAKDDISSHTNHLHQKTQPTTPNSAMKTSRAQLTPRVEISKKRPANSPGLDPPPSKHNRTSSSRLSRYDQHDVGDLGRPIFHTPPDRTGSPGIKAGALDTKNCPEVSPHHYFQESSRKTSSPSHAHARLADVDTSEDVDKKAEQPTHSPTNPPRASSRERHAISSIPDSLSKSSQNSHINKERHGSPMCIRPDPETTREEEKPTEEQVSEHDTVSNAPAATAETKQQDAWHDRTRIRHKDVHIIRDQQELLEDQSSWIPAGPGCLTPKAYVPPFLLKQWNDAYANWRRHGSIDAHTAANVPEEQAKPVNSKSQESGDSAPKVASGNTELWGSLGDSTLLDAMSAQNTSGEAAFVVSQQHLNFSGEKKSNASVPEQGAVPDDDHNRNHDDYDDNEDVEDIGDVADGMSDISKESSPEAEEGAAVDELDHYSLDDDTSSTDSGESNDGQNDYPPSSNPAPPDTPPPPATHLSPNQEVVDQQASTPSENVSNEDDDNDEDDGMQSIPNPFYDPTQAEDDVGQDQEEDEATLQLLNNLQSFSETFASTDRTANEDGEKSRPDAPRKTPEQQQQQQNQQQKTTTAADDSSTTSMSSSSSPFPCISTPLPPPLAPPPTLPQRTSDGQENKVSEVIELSSSSEAAHPQSRPFGPSSPLVVSRAPTPDGSVDGNVNAEADADADVGDIDSDAFSWDRSPRNT